MDDILCTYCGRWKSSAETAGSKYCHPMFGGREHLFDGNHPAHGPTGGRPLSEETRARLKAENHPAPYSSQPDAQDPRSAEKQRPLRPGEWREIVRRDVAERKRLAVLAVQRYALEEGAGEIWLGDMPVDEVHPHAAKIVEIVAGVLAGKQYVRVGDDENWEWVLQ